MCALPGSKSTNGLCTSSGCERQTLHCEKQPGINQAIHSLHSSFECLLHVFRLYHGVNNAERLFNICFLLLSVTMFSFQRGNVIAEENPNKQTTN